MHRCSSSCVALRWAGSIWCGQLWSEHNKHQHQHWYQPKLVVLVDMLCSPPSCTSSTELVFKPTQLLPACSDAYGTTPAQILLPRLVRQQQQHNSPSPLLCSPLPTYWNVLSVSYASPAAPANPSTCASLLRHIPHNQILAHESNKFLLKRTEVDWLMSQYRPDKYL